MAGAAARSRSDDQGVPAAGTGASTPARGYRPSFRLNQRPVRRDRALAGHRCRTLPESVSKAPPLLVPLLLSGMLGVVPSASLRLGPAGRAGWAAASQTCLAICEALTWPSLICFSRSGGAPQVLPCS